MNFSIELAQQSIESNNRFPVSFDLAWVYIGYSRKDNAKRSLLNAGFIENEDIMIETEPKPTGVANGYTNEKIFLTVECFQKWHTMSNVKKSRKTLGFIYVL